MSNTKELAKSFEPAGIEERWYPVWEQRGYFDAGLDPSKPSFSIQLPPPNITGILHMGHAFNQTVMDSLTRYYRMSGYNTMWLPGTDHAGIATQIVVERLLQKEGKDKRDIGRDAFVERIWEWQKFSGGTILNQMRRLGDSLDWKRLYFTITTSFRPSFAKRSSNSTTKVSSTRACVWSTGIRNCNRLSPILKSKAKKKPATCGNPLPGRGWFRRRRGCHYPSGNTLRRSGRCCSPRRRTLQAPGGQDAQAAAHRPRNSRYRRRICRQGFRFGLREDHAGSRL